MREQRAAAGMDRDGAMWMAQSRKAGEGEDGWRAPAPRRNATLVGVAGVGVGGKAWGRKKG